MGKKHCLMWYAGEFKTINNRSIPFVRKFLGLTQKEFGKKIGKSRRTITYYETGGKKIPDHVTTIINFMLKEHNESLSKL